MYKDKQKAPKQSYIAKFGDNSLELTSGVEPPTSSLPMKCSAYWATSALLQYCIKCVTHIFHLCFSNYIIILYKKEFVNTKTLKKEIEFQSPLHLITHYFFKFIIINIIIIINAQIFLRFIFCLKIFVVFLCVGNIMNIKFVPTF